MATHLRALIVEDVEDDAALLVRELEKGGYEIEYLRVDTAPALAAALAAGGWDIVFADYRMPRFNGIVALHTIREAGHDMPFIFVSGVIGEETAVQAIKAGAQDYIMKGNMRRLVPTVERELRDARLRQEQRASEALIRRLSMAVEQAPDCIVIMDRERRIEYVNPAFELTTGYAAAEVRGCVPDFLIAEGADQETYKDMWATVSGGGTWRNVISLRRKNGEVYYSEEVVNPLCDENDDITHYVATGGDITAKVEHEQARARFIAILEATTDIVAMADAQGRVRYLNEAGRRVLGVKPEDDLSRLDLFRLGPEWSVAMIRGEGLEAVRAAGVWSAETALLDAEGHEVAVSQVLLAHRDDGRISYYSTIARDISERKRFEEELSFRATHDTLTGLPNRGLLRDRLEQAISQALRMGGRVALLFLDLDDFKRINDTLGHSMGDRLLREMAQRLRRVLRVTDTVGRHGGDEFIIILPANPQLADVLTVVRKLRTMFSEPFDLAQERFHASISVGIALYPADGSDAETLIRNADTAMYRAKERGKDNYQFYVADMHVRRRELLTLEAELRRALERGEFVLHYQPQIGLKRRKAAGVEALVRWRHPQHGLMPPREFLPLMEDNGLILALGEWALHESAAQWRRWVAASQPVRRVAVNVSARQFSSGDIVQVVRGALQEEGVPPEALELEVAETAVMENTGHAAEVIKALRALGVRCSIDDFGTGYASVSHLKRFAVDQLKIDGAFVQGIPQDRDAAAITEAIICLGHNFGMEVMAEGVESQPQFDFLRHHGCDGVQGYFMGRPMSPTDLEQYWKHGAPH